MTQLTMVTVQKMVVRKNYAKKSARRISEKVLDQTGKDINSHLYKHSVETGYQTLEVNDYGK